MTAAIWVLAEHRDGRALPAALELVAAARRLGGDVAAFAFGEGAGGLAQVLGSHGADRLVDCGPVGDFLADARVGTVLADAAARGAPEAFLFPSTTDGRDIAARLSVKLDRPVIANVVGLARVDGVLVAEHAVFGGSTLVHSRFTGDTPGIFLIRPKSFAAEDLGGAPAAVEQAPAVGGGGERRASVLARRDEHAGGPALDEASVVVSGGRGLGDPANYALVEDLARLLGGAPGASRAIVDAGWVPFAYQVGQTGTTVKPDVYIACGISGATQHLVGMKGARHIVVINTDATAPIFAAADLGVVGDATDVLPRLIAALRARA